MQKILTAGFLATFGLFGGTALGEEASCMARGDYFGQGPAGRTPSIFAPGIASTHHHDDWVPTFSPDGSEVVLRILGKVEGVTRGVFFGSSRGEDGCWSIPQPLSFSGDFMDGAVAFSPDGDRLIFTSKRPVDSDDNGELRSRVWFSDRIDDGWSEPVLLASPINQFNVNGGVSMAADGTLYVAMDAIGGLGRHDIYVLPLVNGRYSGFRSIRGSVNTEDQEVAPQVDPDQRYLLYTIRHDDGVSVVLSIRNEDGEWSRGEPIPALIQHQSKFGGISPDGTRMFFVSHEQREESNPQAVWPLDLFDGPALDANADIYWLAADWLVETMPEK